MQSPNPQTVFKVSGLSHLGYCMLLSSKVFWGRNTKQVSTSWCWSHCLLTLCLCFQVQYCWYITNFMAGTTKIFDIPVGQYSPRRTSWVRKSRKRGYNPTESCLASETVRHGPNPRASKTATCCNPKGSTHKPAKQQSTVF